jgi:hypothetical protein
MPPTPRTIRDLLRDRAHDDATALRFEDERWSWAETNKILKRVLRRERWECADPVWLREGATRYRRLAAEDVVALRERFRAHGREAVLEA